ncbi:MAG: lipid-A-disaccharide synthase N-terminal domain-containing protein [Verrucomicrobiales bacterium]
MLVDISKAVGGYLHQIFVQSIDGWVVLGILGQVFFTARFLTQWIASEKAGKSVIPLSFWFFSIGGGLMLLAYALYRRDPVFILGQAFGLFIYVRNLMLIRKSKGPDK